MENHNKKDFFGFFVERLEPSQSITGGSKSEGRTFSLCGKTTTGGKAEAFPPKSLRTLRKEGAAVRTTKPRHVNVGTKR